MKKARATHRITMLLLCVASLFILIPVYLVVVNSFKSRNSAALMNLSLPDSWHLADNYLDMIREGNVWVGFRNSVLITVICVFLIILLSSSMAFILQRNKDRLARSMNQFVILGLVLPLQIIPTFFVCDFLGLSHVLSAIFVLIVANMSFTVFLYTGYLKSIPADIDESAWLDGAGTFTLFFHIIFPLLTPVTVTSIIISFMAVWNDFGISIYFLNSARNFTLPLTIYNFFGNHGNDWNLVFANVVFSTLPVAVIYLSLQKYIITGMTSGAVKG